MWTYKILKDLPTPPDEFLALANQHAEAKTWGVDLHGLHQKYADRVVLKDGEKVGFTFHYYQQLNEEFTKWCQDNIHPDAFDCGVRFCDGNRGPYLAPHTDIKRDIAIMYLLDPGGEDAETFWYQEEDQDIVRGRKVHANDYSKLSIVDSVKFPTNTWVILNTLILHGVENVTGVRTALQLSANTNIWE
jgi:hypothetical protein